MNRCAKEIANHLLVCSSFFVSIPNFAIADFPLTAERFESNSNGRMIQNLFHQAEMGDIEGIGFQLNQIAQMLQSSDDALTDSCWFLQDLVNAMNTQYGVSLTVSSLLHLTRETVQQFQIPENQMEKYFVGLDLIEYHQSELNSLGSVRLMKHHKEKSNFWTWLSIATVTAAAVTVCIVVPQVAPAIIGGAVEIGKAALGK